MRKRLAHVLATSLGLAALTVPAVVSPPEAVALGIESATLHISQTGPNWTITIRATETFTSQEIQQRWTVADRADLFERDTGEPFGGSDDHLMFWPEESFQVTRARETWIFSATANSGTLDTENGSERIYGVVKLRNVSTGGNTHELRTAITTIDP
jgi:hypothetical protein